MYVVKKTRIRTTCHINSHYLKMSGTNLNIIMSLHDIPCNIHIPSQRHELTSFFSFMSSFMCPCSFTKKSVSDRVVMLPDEEVVDGDVGNLGFSSIWSQKSQPVLRGNDIVRVGGGLSQFQSTEELLELFRGQGVDVLPHHRGFPLVTVWSGPSKFTQTTVVPCKVTCNTDSKLNHVDDVPGST